MTQTPDDQHPGPQTLLAYRGGRLPLDQRLALEAHLRLCASCRGHFDCQAETQPLPSRAAELPEILAAMRKLGARRVASQPLGACKTRAAAQLDPYLGAQAVTCMMEQVSADCRNLLSEVQPVLGLFLGRRAGGRLASRIVHALAPNL